MKKVFATGIFALLGFVTLCTAGGRLELQSTYIGDGWFQYRLVKPTSPTFWSVDVPAFIVSSTNRLEYGTDPAGWTNVLTQPSDYAQWDYDSTNIFSQPRFYQWDFLVHSAENTFRTTTNAFAVVSVRLVSQWFNFAEGGGYVSFPALTPCAPSLADASATNLTSSIDLGDDLVINRLVVSSNSILGISFNWSRKCTVLLQGSTDAVHWTNAAIILGNPGDNTWTTNHPLNDLGNFFRLELVAVNRHLTSLPSFSPQVRTEVSTTEKKDAAPSLTFLPRGEDVVVQFMSESGREYFVQANDANGGMTAVERTVGTGRPVEVRFKAAGLPNPVFFTVKASP